MSMRDQNRLYNATNPAQGRHKKVLCLCSAGLLRSPTAAVVLSQAPFNFNTRAAGLVSEYALVLVDGVLIHWADEVVCMTEEQGVMLRESGCKKPIICLNIEDNYEYRDPKLMDLISNNYKEAVKWEGEVAK